MNIDVVLPVERKAYRTSDIFLLHLREEQAVKEWRNQNTSHAKEFILQILQSEFVCGGFYALWEVPRSHICLEYAMLFDMLGIAIYFLHFVWPEDSDITRLFPNLCFQLHNLVCHPAHHKPKDFSELIPFWNRESILPFKPANKDKLSPSHLQLLWLIALLVHVNLSMRSCLILRLIPPSRVAWDFTLDCWWNPLSFLIIKSSARSVAQGGLSVSKTIMKILFCRNCDPNMKPSPQWETSNFIGDKSQACWEGKKNVTGLENGDLSFRCEVLHHPSPIASFRAVDLLLF